MTTYPREEIEAAWAEYRRRGVETHDWPNVRDRILAAGARYTPRGADPATERDGGWVHPRELHGLLLGISRTTVAWEWSGRPELVKKA